MAERELLFLYLKIHKAKFIRQKATALSLPRKAVVFLWLFLTLHGDIVHKALAALISHLYLNGFKSQDVCTSNWDFYFLEH